MEEHGSLDIFICLFSNFNYIFLAALAVTPSIRIFIKGQYKQEIVSVATILIVIIVFQVIHTWYGLFHDNVYEVYATITSQCFISAVGIIQVINNPGHWDPYDIIELCYSIGFLAIYLGFAYPLHKEYSWTFYKLAGADPDFRRRFRTFLRFQVVIKFHLMVLFVNGLVMGFAQGSRDFSWTLSIDFAYFLLGISFYICGKYGTTKESVPLMISFWSLFLGIFYVIAYGLYYVIRFKIVSLQNFSWDKLTKSEEINFLVMYFVSVTLLIVLSAMLIYLSIKVYLNFGFGLDNLRDSINKSQNHGSLIVEPINTRTVTEGDAIDAILKNTIRKNEKISNPQFDDDSSSRSYGFSYESKSFLNNK